MKGDAFFSTLFSLGFLLTANFVDADEGLFLYLPDTEMESEAEPICAPCEEPVIECEPLKKWYFELKPGYYYFTEPTMREFFDNGGVTIRGEAGFKFWGPFIVWMDGGYFQKDGNAIGGLETTKIMLATMTLGLKTIWYPCSRLAFYLGVAPRIFLMKIHNESPFVPSEDNEFGIGGAFTGGIWLFPIPSCPNIFIDLFGDYSWKKLKVEEDEGSSMNFDVDVSGITGGIGLGVRF